MRELALHSRDVSAVLCERSSVVSRLPEQVSWVSAVKCSMPVRSLMVPSLKLRLFWFFPFAVRTKKYRKTIKDTDNQLSIDVPM